MKIKIATALFLLYGLHASAQEITVKLNGGPSGILYDSSIGDGQLKIGGGLGIGYTYFFSNHWGINSGLDFMYNQNSFKLNDGNTISSYKIDDQGSAFEYQVSPKNYKEDQHFMSFAVPVLLQYRTSFASQTEWYLGFGGKILFPGKQKIKASADEIQLSGYYPDLNILIDDLPSHGFGKVTNWKDEASVSLDPTFLISVETGLTFKLKENMKLYTGVYADYGLTNLTNDNPNANIVTYSPSGINNLQAEGVIGNNKVVQETRYFSAGIQLKLGFSLNKSKSQPAEMAQPQNVTESVAPKAEPAPAPQKVPEPATKPKEITAEQRAYIEKPLAFNEIGNTSVTPELAERLDGIAKILNENNDVELNVTGYTCDIGTEKRNLEIGQLRAQAVADYLKNKGIQNSRIHLFSKGENDPLVPNTPAENKPLNRRVSLVLIDK
ncbi:OmpA family protein [Flavobacterium sp. KACC 22761]|uniref:OmpA family protein n=1 Tax=Flavobacterium sp. KACC 22761 TaxID=3092665 RepID=UPI002A7517B3|nr:OmpA family protein [Flavobacterium sp. KACC 22761]WPO78347.1 OmpA family protein [Flavobacterium sp. KACC 22761]